MSRMVTVDSLDDSLIEKRQKEVAELKKENDSLRLDLSHMTDRKTEWNKKFNDLLIEHRKIQQENLELTKKLLQYEHDPIKVDICTESIDILYWDDETNDYELFATFFNNNLEKDMEEFCNEFVMELKDAYVIV